MKTSKTSWTRGSMVLALGLGLGTACGWGVDPYANDIGGDGDDEVDPDGNPDPDDGPPPPSDDGPPATSGDDNGTGGATGDGGTDATGEVMPQCAPTPTRMVVLGDSIFACFGVGGKMDARCSALQVQQYVGSTVAPVSYENLAVNGARTIDVVNTQLPAIDVGQPGHVLVLIFIGGNDLAAHIFSSDDAATNAWEDTMGPQVAQAWEDIFAFLGDAGNFPDGVTVLMNTQYNPFDDCTASPYPTVTPVKTEILHMHNEALTARAAARDWVYIADQHPSYLGHGHHFENAECPHTMSGYAGWMADLIHPDANGHENLTKVIGEVVDQMYVDCE